MIPLKRVDHISMAARDWRQQAALLEKLLGFRFLRSFDPEAGPGSDFGGCVSSVPNTGIEFEILEPSGRESFVQKFIDERGTGLHHITVEVEDLEAAIAEMERLGLRPFGGVCEDAYWRMTYIHPRDSGGVLWQLFVQKRPWPDVPPQPPASGGLTGLLRVDHASLAVPDIEKAIDWHQRVLGMEVRGRWEAKPLGYFGAILAIPGSQLAFEIIAPSQPDSFVQRFIEERRPGLHHICCEVASVEAAAEGLRGVGIEPYGGVVDEGWKKHTFIHPRDSGGVLFQLIEESGEKPG